MKERNWIGKIDTRGIDWLTYQHQQLQLHFRVEKRERKLKRWSELLIKSTNPSSEWFPQSSVRPMRRQTWVTWYELWIVLTSDLRSNSIFTEFLFSLMRGERRVPPPVKFSTKKNSPDWNWLELGFLQHSGYFCPQQRCLWRATMSRSAQFRPDYGHNDIMHQPSSSRY